MTASTEIALTDEEFRLGFSEQTLSYPAAGFDLSGLEAGASSTLERTVALDLGGANRIRRRRSGPGYLHERLEGGAWKAVAVFESVEALAASELYADHMRLMLGHAERPAGEEGAGAE